MKNITVVYIHNETNEYSSFHVQYANKKKLQEALDSHDVYMIEHILEQTRTIAVNEFEVFSSQADVAEFINKWNLDY